MAKLKGVKRAATYLFYALLILLAAISIFSAVQGATGSSFPLLVVKSGSMEPVIHPGDIIITAPVKPSEIRADPRDGDVIVFFKPPYYGDLNYLIVHRAIGVVDGGFVTKGDANSIPDPWSPVPPNYVVGKWTGMKLPYWTGIGYLSLFLRGEVFSPYGRIVLVLIIAVNALLILLEFRRAWKESRKAPA
ncbi:MAG: signal peptidase I [Candidatus Terraquivivens tikiterensis]|uniref:Signal peptidase I n=1 Tax=Candidatus Terraquivivens tikiterensis TaxID=1980982 RepID=A0A2R7Y1N4_9ARCH|nr:MAG: signal peptidase I [Candidatus Terraquivivens tikiterensis]